MRHLRSSGALLLAVMTVALIGCGKTEAPRYRVAGVVKYKGEPVKAGTITFRSVDGQSNGVGNILNGDYDIPATSGLPTGKYQVTVSYPDPKAPAAPPEGNMPGDSMALPKDLLPAKYNSKSELSAEIKAVDRNEANFDLK